MQLIAYLEQLTPSTLRKILEEHGLQTKQASPNQLVELILDQLLEQEKIKTVYQYMNDNEKEVLNYFIIHNPNQMFAYRKLERLNGRLTRDQFEDGVTRLRRKGILYTIRRSWGDIGFIIPEDLYQAWHIFFFADVINQANIAEEIDASKRTTFNLEEDMFGVLSYLEKVEIPVTQKGTIHKRYVTTLLEQIKLEEVGLKYFPFKKKFNADYPQHLQILLELAMSLGLITYIDKLQPTSLTTNWYQLSATERRDLLTQWIRVLFNSTEIMHKHFLYCLLYLPENQWYSIDEMLQPLAKLMSRPMSQEIYERAMLEVLIPLQTFGWIELGNDQSEQSFVRRIVTQEQEWKQIYVQPNYEILVPQGFPYHLRADLEQFASKVQQDQMNKYILTKETVMKSLTKGKTIETVIEFLSTYSALPIQENMVATINDWAKQYGTISFMDVRLIKCESERIAKELKIQPLINEWIIGEINQTHLIIKREKFEQLINTLHQLGYYPVNGIWTENTALDKKEEEFWDEEDQPFRQFRESESRIENIFPPLVHW